MFCLVRLAYFLIFPTQLYCSFFWGLNFKLNAIGALWHCSDILIHIHERWHSTLQDVIFFIGESIPEQGLQHPRKNVHAEANV